MPGGEGFEPDLPEDGSYLVLAHCPDLSVISLDAHSGVSGLDPSLEVDPELHSLLLSGQRYPPALALARRDSEGTGLTGTSFVEAYRAAVRHHLSEQSKAGYHLAEAVGDEPGYLTPGEWYWVTGSSVSDSGVRVRWVSDDYFVYTNALSDFAIDDDTADRLHQKER